MKPPRAIGRLLVLALLISGCALPLPKGVQTAGSVPVEQRQGGVVQVLPPGPKAGAPPEEVVVGFLGAQSNSDGRHAIARKFLTPQLSSVWSDDAEVLVYEPATLDVRQVGTASNATASNATDRASVRVTSRVSGVIRSDGSYSPRVPAMVVENYQLRKVEDGGWQLTDVPAGLRLTAADRMRSFRPFALHYLAPAIGDDPLHLVPDMVLLPVSNNPAETLVKRLLQPPSRAVAGSVTTAFPPSTQAMSVNTSVEGVVNVDLTSQVLAVTGARRQALSAQLVWTLRGLQAGFTGLRVTVDGAPFVVPDQGEVQDAGTWNAFDPEGLTLEPPYYFVQDRRLRADGDTLLPGPATAGEVGDGQALPIDVVAVTPDRTRVGLLTRGADGTVTIRSGPLRAATFPVLLRGPGLTSPTWGSGERGLWLLRGGAEVVLVTADGDQVQVPVSAGPVGPFTSLKISRDGARAALVAGGRLWVGRVDVSRAVPRLVDFLEVAPGLRGATRVAWATSTNLVVLANVLGAVLPVRVAVDGLTVEPMDGANRPESPVDVAAAPNSILVASGGRLYGVTVRGFTVGQPGKAPAYPG